MVPTISDCASLTRKLEQYEALPYVSVERALWMLISAELLITVFSIVALVPDRGSSGGGKSSGKKGKRPGWKIHRSLRRTPVVVGLLLAHIELLNAFFTLEQRRAAMTIRPEELLACPHLAPTTAKYKLHISKTNTPGPTMIIAFVCACIAGVLLLRFVVSTFDERQIYDDIAAEYHASYDFIVPDKVACPEKVHLSKPRKAKPPSRIPPQDDIV